MMKRICVVGALIVLAFIALATPSGAQYGPTTTVAVAPTTTLQTAPSGLVRTGSDSLPLAQMGIVLVAAGGLAVYVARSRRRQADRAAATV
jgi:hypothetical protein